MLFFSMQIFLMKDHVVAKLLLRSLVRQCIGKCEDIQLTISKEEQKKLENTCGGFLCAGNSCRLILNITSTSALFSLVYILINTANDPLNVIVPALKLDPSWSNYLDRQQVQLTCKIIFVWYLKKKLFLYLYWKIFY